ncbi:UNVERIFIED_ORG: hypothetical protein ABIC62_006133 [Burkholderia sp. 1595]|uniref:Uncharacterized protein n=1 Tax=Paraburkholderia terricola TaxID=169427 RepID=A0ABU1M177_9BURK|nr:hypothetical protein [Paraburkholderia terricola]MDR6412769.1 hypothetical protein [Paraburkholderia terricola]
MATITVIVKNTTSDALTVHVFDLFANGRREIFDPRENREQPFNLAHNEATPPLAVNAEADLDILKGRIAYEADHGPRLDRIPVEDGQTVEIT